MTDPCDFRDELEKGVTMTTQVTEALLREVLERAKQWLYLDDGSPYADEETRAMVNAALASAGEGKECDCQCPEPESGTALISETCPIHNHPNEHRKNCIALLGRDPDEPPAYAPDVMKRLHGARIRFGAPGWPDAHLQFIFDVLGDAIAFIEAQNATIAAMREALTKENKS